MKYDSITLDSFIANQNVKIEKKDSMLSISINQNHTMSGVIIKNIDFAKNKQYILYINVQLPTNTSLFFYSNDVIIYNPTKKIYLTNGTNKININIKHKNIIDIGFLIEKPVTGMTFNICDIDIIDKMYDMDNTRIKQLTNIHFNDNVGFGKHKDIAIKLLRDTIEILDEFSIDYFLISGTLLGYVRHNDFIPWDDDIDLIVDASLIDKLPEIIQKYTKVKFITAPISKWIMKSYYEKRIILDNNTKVHWPANCKWTWPFIDLFIFGYTDDKKNINFFNKNWDVTKFYPVQKKPFLGMIVSVPSDPDYFLRINYGSDYMTILKSSDYCHKYERGIGSSVNMHAKLLKYNNI